MDSWYRKSLLMQFSRDWLGVQSTAPNKQRAKAVAR